MRETIRKIIIISLLLAVFAPTLSLAQSQKTPPLRLSESLMKTTKTKLGRELPVIERIWNKYILSSGKKAFRWIKNKIWPRIEGIIKKDIQPRVRKEIIKRKPIVKEGIRKEREETKKELPRVTKSAWQRLRELIK